MYKLLKSIVSILTAYIKLWTKIYYFYFRRRESKKKMSSILKETIKKIKVTEFVLN